MKNPWVSLSKKRNFSPITVFPSHIPSVLSWLTCFCASAHRPGDSCTRALRVYCGRTPFPVMPSLSLDYDGTSEIRGPSWNFDFPSIVLCTLNGASVSNDMVMCPSPQSTRGSPTTPFTSSCSTVDFCKKHTWLSCSTAQKHSACRHSILAKEQFQLSDFAKTWRKSTDYQSG